MSPLRKSLLRNKHLKVQIYEKKCTIYLASNAGKSLPVLSPGTLDVLNIGSTPATNVEALIEIIKHQHDSFLANLQKMNDNNQKTNDAFLANLQKMNDAILANLQKMNDNNQKTTDALLSLAKSKEERAETYRQKYLNALSQLNSSSTTEQKNFVKELRRTFNKLETESKELVKKI